MVRHINAEWKNQSYLKVTVNDSAENNGEKRFYSRYKFLSLYTINVSGDVKGSDDVENIVSRRESSRFYKRQQDNKKTHATLSH